MNIELIKEIKREYRIIEQIAAKENVRPNITQDQAKIGLTISKLGSRHPDQVPMSPLKRNALIAFGDIKTGERLMTDAPVTEFEKWLTESVSTLLLKLNGKRSDGYNENLPLDSPDHYRVDCWNNFHEGLDWRFVRPNQEEEVNEMIGTYVEPPKTVSVMKLLDDPVYAKAVEVVYNDLPEVRASDELKEINLPFMTKHTNVGFPYFGNDKTMDPKTGLSYAQVTMRDAESIKDTPEKVFKFNVATEFTRYQGKGRLIQAVARIPNLIFNQLESVEIANYKVKSSMFAGYNDGIYLKQVLTTMLEDCKAKGLKCANFDQSRYDSHVAREFIMLVGAISAVKAQGQRSKVLARLRAAMMTKTWLVAGTLDEILEVYGRIFSGEIDTNRAGGVNNGINSLYVVMRQDRQYINDIASQLRWFMLVMGDDLLVAYKTLDYAKYDQDMEALGYKTNSKKLAFGAFFLQNRVCKDDQDHLVMLYPWTRVVRSMLDRERPAGLGDYGWEVTYYQQLYKLIQWPKYLAPVVNIIAMFDNKHLCVDYTVEEIIAGVNAEDAKVKADDPKHYVSTWDKLNDGDPTKQHAFTESGEMKPSYLQEIHDAIVAVYDPNYLINLGIRAPKTKQSESA